MRVGIHVFVGMFLLRSCTSWIIRCSLPRSIRSCLFSTATASFPITTLTLHRSRQSKAFWQGNPLVFPKAIAGGGTANDGELVHITVPDNNRTQSIGFGIYNSQSLYRIRILVHSTLQPTLYQQVLQSPDSTTAMNLILQHHIQQAFQKRQFLNLPSSQQTTLYRLVHGEGDALSGLAVDVLNDSTMVVMSSALWCQLYKEQILDALHSVVGPHHDIIWKTTPSRLAQDGMTHVNDDDDDDEDNDTNNQLVVCRENGILYHTYPYQKGQKTGVYCDQRENRLLISQYCHNKRVLDLCCYHGGFALHAMVLGQAASATAVDSSAQAIEACRTNARVNQVTIECICSDVTTFVQQQSDDNSYDVIILDPPKLAPSTTGLDKARRKYHSLNRDAIKLMSKKDGGLFLTCTCSAAMTQKDGGQYFLEMVHGAAMAAGRHVSLMHLSGAASCHTRAPMAQPAGDYLTAALFAVHPIYDY